MENHLLPLHRSLTVFLSDGEMREPVAQAAARLAVRGPVILLDGANSAPAYRLVRLICSLTPDPETALRRVFVRRAFTCHQMLTLLEGALAAPHPHILLSPLDPLLVVFGERRVADPLDRSDRDAAVVDQRTRRLGAQDNCPLVAETGVPGLRFGDQAHVGRLLDRSDLGPVFEPAITDVVTVELAHAIPPSGEPLALAPQGGENSSYARGRASSLR